MTGVVTGVSSWELRVGAEFTDVELDVELDVDRTFEVDEPPAIDEPALSSCVAELTELEG